MSVYHRLAANSIQNQVKKGRWPKTFWPGLKFSVSNFAQRFKFVSVLLFLVLALSEFQVLID